jgi:hypothetical protein
VTVVDSQIAEKSLMERLGERKQVIYSVEDLATEFDLRLKNDYTGPTEFLVYGMVHPSKFSILPCLLALGLILFTEAIVGIFNFNDILALSSNNRGIRSVLKFDLIRRNRHAGFLGCKLKRLAPSLHFGTGQIVGKQTSVQEQSLTNLCPRPPS